MKGTPSALLTAMSAEVTTICGCWLVERSDGTVLSFTDHQSDLTIDALTYEAASGFSRTAISQSSGLSVDNLDIVGVLDSTAITEQDLRAGLYRNAEVWYFEVDYTDVTLGKHKLDYGYLGEVTVSEGMFVAEFRSLMQRLDQEIGEKAGRYCRVPLGSTLCGVTLATWTETGTITTATSNRQFIDTARTEADDYFRFGVLTFTSGLNNGLEMDVKHSTSSGLLEMRHTFPFDVAVGDTYSVYAGCNHLLKMPSDVAGTAYTGDCRAKFNNVVNFQGEPEIPGPDALFN